MQFKLAYGQKTLNLELEDKLSATVLKGRDLARADDPRAEIAAALRKPFGSEPIARLVSSSDRVAVIVNDITRPAPTKAPNTTVLMTHLTGLGKWGRRGLQLHSRHRVLHCNRKWPTGGAVGTMPAPHPAPGRLARRSPRGRQASGPQDDLHNSLSERE